MSSILVTGGSGQLGSAVLRALDAPGRQLVTMSRRPPIDLERAACVYIPADLAATAEPVAGLESVTSAVFLASRITVSADPVDIQPQANLELRGMARLLTGLPVIEHIVYASSFTVYGPAARLPADENDPTEPVNVYSCTKIATEEFLRQFSQARGVPVAVLRIAQVYGRGSPPSEIIARLCATVASGVRPVVTCGPDAFRDYVHEDDVVSAIVTASDRRFDGTLNIGSGVATRILSLAEHAAARHQLRPIVSMDMPTFSFVSSIARAKSALGFAPRHSTNEEIARRLPID